MKTGLIYKHTCTITNESYIGQTINSMEDRLKNHLMSAKNKDPYKFQEAINKYGIENFESEILEKNIPLISILKYKDNLLNIREIYWIKQYDSFMNGYNMTLGGGGMSGYIKSEESIEKMKNTINNKSDDEKKLISINNSKRLTEYYSKNVHHTKNKTYDEILGSEKAKEIKKLRSINNPMKNPIFKEKARLNRLDAIKKKPLPKGRDSKLFGKQKSESHKENLKLSFKLNNHAKGSKNSQAKKWILIFNNDEFFIEGTLESFCCENKIKSGTLKQFIGNEVPKPNRKCSVERTNTTGWKLVEVV